MIGVQQASPSTTTTAFGSPVVISSSTSTDPRGTNNNNNNNDPFDESVEFHNKFQNFVNGNNNGSSQSMFQSFHPVFQSEDHFQASIYNFISCRKDFANKGKPIGVEVMFHYTKKKNMESIGLSGLQGISRRTFYGNGIYVANNPHAFKSYGNIGLIVLVMKGNRKWCLYNEERTTDDDTDSFAGNKLYSRTGESSSSSIGASPYFDETVLRSDDQVLPLFQYPRSLTNNSDLFTRIQQQLQSWANEMFPGSWPLRTQMIRPTVADLKHETNVVGWMSGNREEAMFITAEDQYKNSPWKLIFQKLSQPRVSLGEETCDPKHLKRRQQQQQQQQQKQEPIGSCPQGRLMIERRRDIHCASFKGYPTLVLSYDVPSGFDQHYGFRGAKHTAFLPENDMGRALLIRLCYAFRQGLTFYVAAPTPSQVCSSPTLNHGQVLGTGIPHKTSLEGGNKTNGWPDPNYFTTCNDYLDGLGVPPSNELPCSFET